MNNNILLVLVVLSKRFASLDIFSQGRAIAGFGIGWSKDEFQASNVPFNNEGKRADEYVKVLKKIWTEENVEFRGQYYNIPQSKIGPKPLQKPHIPFYIGGFSSNTITRIVENDLDGWLGIIGGVAPFGYVESIINSLKDEATKKNKSVDNFKIILLAYPYVEDNAFISSDKENMQRPTLTGTTDEIGDDISKIKGLGVDHVIFGYNSSSVGKDIDKMIDLTKQFSRFAK